MTTDGIDIAKMVKSRAANRKYKSSTQESETTTIDGENHETE